MNYYNEIKNRLIDNEVYLKVKDIKKRYKLKKYVYKSNSKEYIING